MGPCMLWALKIPVALSLITLSLPLSSPTSLAFFMFLFQHSKMTFFKHKVQRILVNTNTPASYILLSTFYYTSFTTHLSIHPIFKIILKCRHLYFTPEHYSINIYRAFLTLLKHAKHFHATGPLHVLLPTPGILSS